MRLPYRVEMAQTATLLQALVCLAKGPEIVRAELVAFTPLPDNVITASQ